MQPVVIKIGGHELEDAALLREFAVVIRDFAAPVIIVHGGGKEISELQQKLGIEPRYVAGVRITDAPSLAVVEMVLCGIVNKRIVRYLNAAGVDALGLSGIDRKLIQARQMQNGAEDMGFTGEVTAVRGEVLQSLLQQDVTPVIAPVSYGEESAYNVNADHVAGAVAAAVGAESIVFLTNVEGVLRDGQVIPALSVEQTEQLIHEGIISGCMIPKVKTALGVLDDGVPQAVITNLAGLKRGGGTVFTRQPSASSHTESERE